MDRTMTVIARINDATALRGTMDSVQRAPFHHTHEQGDVIGLDDALRSKIGEPASEGTSGQVLTTDGRGGRSWTTVRGGGGAVDSVNGKTGTVVLEAADVGAAEADHVHDPGDVTGLTEALAAKQDAIDDLQTIRSGAALGATAVQPVSGKGLSSNDFTNSEKDKLDGIREETWTFELSDGTTVVKTVKVGV